MKNLINIQENLLYIPIKAENEFEYTKDKDDHKGRAKELNKFDKSLNRSLDILDELYTLHFKAASSIKPLIDIEQFALNDVIFTFMAKEYGKCAVHFERLSKFVRANKNDAFIKEEWPDFDILNVKTFDEMLDHIGSVSLIVKQEVDFDVIKSAYKAAYKEEKESLL